jgi:hypothetical protein
MSNAERLWRHYFLALQNYGEKSLEKFYQQNLTEFILREGKLKLNGFVADEDKAKQIIGRYVAKQITRGDDLFEGMTVETSNVEGLQEIFIERSIAMLPKTDTLQNVSLIKKIKAYDLFLKQLQKPDKLINDNIVFELYKEFNNKNFIWEGNIDIAEFLSCFNLSRQPLVKLSYKTERRMISVLKEIDRVNDKVAFEHFQIKNYKQKKSMNEKRTPNSELMIINKIKSIITPQ